MIEDFTNYDEVKEGECFTTGIIDSAMIDNQSIINIYFIDSNGNEWVIKEMEDGPPIVVRKEE